MTLPCISNHVSLTTFQAAPWEFVPGEIPDEARLDKLAWARWCKLGDTNHLFYSGFVGINPSVRVSRENPVNKCVALIADYDTTISQTELDAIISKLPVELMPTHASRTFSGGARLVFLLEEPIVVDVEPICRAFLSRAGVVLKLGKLLAGWDIPAWQDVVKTYEVGDDWVTTGAKPLSKAIINQMMFEACAKLRPDSMLDQLDGVVIPLEKVRAEVERQFPGRWTGPFEENARGVVLHDPSSVNPSASILTTKGLICFGQEKLFYNWSEILGRSFVEQYVEDRIGRAVDGIYYDCRNYHHKDLRGKWTYSDRSTLTLRLRALGLSEKRTKGGGPLTEIESAINYINENARVDAIYPLVFNPEDMLVFNGKRHLNTAAVKAMAPSDNDEEIWGPEGNFPDISRALETWFDPVEDMYRLMAWWKRFWLSAYQGKLQKGHALFLGGDTSVGKTFLSNKLIATSVGGHAPAAEYLQGNTQFCKQLFEVGMWSIDDGAASKDERGMSKFSERLKSSIVNPSHNFRAMYRDGETIPWSGRIVVTLNMDAVSAKLLPTLDNNISDKLILLKMKQPDIVLSDDYSVNDAKYAAQLPHFLRYLMTWEVPDFVMDGAGRLGCAAYVHPDLRQAANESSGGATLLELIDLHFRGCNREGDRWTKKGNWRGRALDLFQEMSMNDSIRMMVNKLTTSAIGRHLGTLSTLPDARVIKVEAVGDAKKNNHAAIWEIIPEEED